ncbi:MAG: FAD-dependent oxidoreductase [Acidobacteriaceae bacterium]
MENVNGKLETRNTSEPADDKVADWLGADFRPDLAFPALTDDMLDRLRAYGTETSFPGNTTIYRYGDLNTNMYVVLEGGVDIFLPGEGGESRIYARHRKLNFTGEFNLLNSQRAVVEARTAADSRLLCISRKQLDRIMRAEGDIANLIVQACIWRRIGILKAASSGVVLEGLRDDAATRLLQQFLVRNTYPYRVVELSAEKAAADTKAGFPAIGLPDGRVMHRPTIAQLADELGITELPDPHILYDLAVVGAGPAGLAAAVYAASEGLCTVVVESLAPGGQAGTSSKIENYLGFPTGIGGQQLASRAQLQALKFGVHFAISREVVTIEAVDGIHRLTLAGAIPVSARAVVVASGAQYRKLDVTNYAEYENRGIYYAATPMESLLCRDSEVIVVGGGNSAGQAAVYLSGIAKHVHHIVRRPTLATTMSQYLVSRIEKSSHITLHTDSEIVELSGKPLLDRVTWVNNKTGERTQEPIGSVFVMIGAEPNTGWLFGTVRLDSKGFILTGGDCGFQNTPYATSAPGIYAVGDVRANSVKRVASAVGEGSVVISDIHRYLADHHDRATAQPSAALAALRSASVPANA